MVTYVVLGALALIVGGFLAIKVTSKIARLAKAPVAKANALPPDGTLVRVVGTVKKLGDTVAAPYTSRPGVVAVFELWATSRGSKVQQIDRQVVSTPFLVEDDSGSVRVNTDGLDTVLRMGQVSARDADQGAFGAGVLESNMPEQSVREEGVLAVGARVAVIGHVAGGALERVTVSDHPKLLR